MPAILKSVIRRHVFVSVLLVGALIPATAAVAAVKNGASCSKIGQLVTVKQKQTSVDFICTQEGKKKVWRLRPSGATPGGAAGNTPGGTTNPGAANPGGTTTAPGSTAGTSAVTEVASSYAVLADTPYTRVSATATPVGYLATAGFASTTGTSLYDHPSGLASNGRNLVLVDRGNNRILVWNTAPTTSTATPDFVLCQPNTTSVASGSGLSQCNWPSDAVATADGKLLVADSDNHRILVWNTFPTATGQSASFAINLGADEIGRAHV